MPPFNKNDQAYQMEVRKGNGSQPAVVVETSMSCCLTQWFTSSLQNHGTSMLQISSPATPWSCAAPGMISHRSSLNSSTHSTASTGSTRSTSSLTILHNVGATLRPVLLFLERNGVARSSIRELQQMFLNEQYIQAMERAAEYINCILTPGINLEFVIALVVTAWESLVGYSKSAFKEAQKDYSRFQNGYWLEFIETGTMSAHDKARRKRRQLEEYDAVEYRQLKQKLFEAIRFKIDCEKSLVQTAEWSRYLRCHQRRLQNHRNCKKQSS